ncbi:leucyl aminopeptidase [Frankia sp. Cj5]|uniref:leucyl aminopeptidase n=1 Tax=Frankia sp. Cj5 TaxID=2880978 RepID=UPI001EF6741A|nr:leucyl aminopeptidase [Frankia sp. Cj5]
MFDVPADAGWAVPRPPIVTLRAGTPLEVGVPVLALLTFPVGKEVVTAAVTAAGRAVGHSLGLDLDLLLDAERASGEPAEVVVVPLGRADPPTRLLLLGAGRRDQAAWRAAGAAFARRAASASRAAVLADAETGVDAIGLRAFTEGLLLAAYRPLVAALTDGAAALTGDGDGDASDGTTDDRSKALREATIIVANPRDPELRAAVAVATVTSRAVHLARDLANMPSLVKSPEWFAARAVETARAAGLDAHVLGPTELAEQGFGGLAAVGAGSSRPPRLVRLSYDGAPASDPGCPRGRHVALVGKGITFDSGGLSLKPATSMAAMKTDMAGAAAVLATMTALPAMGVRDRVTGLLCLAENMIGGAAMRPGDVVSCWGGTTVEVLNTDAEGRLVLADGLAYAASLAPDAIIDLATLTGAITVALGRRTAGLFSSDDALASELFRAAQTAGEGLWRLPLVDEYRPALESGVADLANIGTALDVSGGSITAALFLREFTGGIPWAHVDIAGTARADSDDGEISKGGTGWGVRTLLAWLTS